ncbi:uncharacterized protein LOC125945782 [Dermacentor silvarum]|uniref:uncharacterized protein LOC125945782 n=1 Tax=Dermacentor silvarum TaxID=543639 RepID=UPI0021014069|nr:uncharacterized protein LOC125945782 [Dermacentor silvarum]
MDSGWIDDTKLWPMVQRSFVYDYMVKAIDQDGKPAQNYRGFAEGINLFDSGNVGKALCQSKDGICSIKADIRSTQTGSRFYSTQISFRPSFSASCNCKAGQSFRCSHVCALLMKVVEATNKGLTGSSCTDKTCVWNASTMKNVTPGTMENVYSHRSKSSCPLQFLTREEMERNFDECTLNLDQLKGTLLCSVLKPPKQVARGASIDASSQEEHGPHSSQLLCTPCRNFYKKYILLSAEQAKKVSEYSQGSIEWFQERSLRIIASEARSIPIKAHPEKWVERRIHPTFRGSTSTRYGRENEPVARAWYKRTKTCDVVEHGLVRPSTSWLGASPDGVILDSDKIIEIKCPAPQTLHK